MLNNSGLATIILEKNLLSLKSVSFYFVIGLESFDVVNFNSSGNIA